MGVPMQFSRNQLLPSTVNGSETDLNKKASLEQKKESPYNTIIGEEKKGLQQYRNRKYKR